MKIREYRSFQIHILEDGSGDIGEVYRKEKLLKTIRDNERGLEEPFRSSAMALEAAREWIIGRTYPERIIRDLYRPHCRIKLILGYCSFFGRGI